MTITPLTPIERRTLRIIGRLTDTRGIPPTYRELAMELGVASPSTPHYAVERLVRKGYVKRSGRASRGIMLTERGVTEQQPRAMTPLEYNLNARIKEGAQENQLVIAYQDTNGEFTAVTITNVRI